MAEPTVRIYLDDNKCWGEIVTKDYIAKCYVCSMEKWRNVIKIEVITDENWIENKPIV